MPWFGSSRVCRSTTSAGRWCRQGRTCSVWSNTSRASSSAPLGEAFGRPSDEPLPWFDEGAEPNADMWATAEESCGEIIAALPQGVAAL